MTRRRRRGDGPSRDCPHAGLRPSPRASPCSRPGRRHDEASGDLPRRHLNASGRTNEGRRGLHHQVVSGHRPQHAAFPDFRHEGERTVTDVYGSASQRRATAWRQVARTALAGPMADRLAPKTLYRFLAGTDSDFVPMSAAEVAALRDPMAALFHGGAVPPTGAEVLAGPRGGGAGPEQNLFL